MLCDDLSIVQSEILESVLVVLLLRSLQPGGQSSVFVWQFLEPGVWTCYRTCYSSRTCLWGKFYIHLNKKNKCDLSPCCRPAIHVTKPKVASKAPDLRGQTTAPISLTLTPTAEQPTRHQGKKKGSTPKAEDSDSDPEAPVAQQMLSFVMDDPDFESEASDTPKIATVNQDTPTVRSFWLTHLLTIESFELSIGSQICNIK